MRSKSMLQIILWRYLRNIESSEEEKKNYLRKERSEVSYYGTLPLQENVASDKVKAKMTDGVLEVILPKTKPTPKPKKRSVTVQ